MRWRPLPRRVRARRAAEEARARRALEDARAQRAAVEPLVRELRHRAAENRFGEKMARAFGGRG